MDVEDDTSMEDPTFPRKRKRSPDFADKETSPLLSADEAIRHHPFLGLALADNDTFRNKKLRLPQNSLAASDTAGWPFPGKTVYELKDLPNGVLQHVFSFLDPLSLARLLQVNRRFQILINPHLALPVEHEPTQGMRARDQDDIWKATKQRWLPHMPRPLPSSTCYDSFRLAFGKSCQFCGRRGSPEPSLSSGSLEIQKSLDVRPFWSYQKRSCIPCLEPQLVQDHHILFSTQSPLMPALPFAFFTSSMELVPSTFLRQVANPTSLDVTKFLYKTQVHALEQELDAVRSLGPQALEEWRKGLHARGQRAESATIEFEKWESRGGLRSLSDFKIGLSVQATKDTALQSRLPLNSEFRKDDSAREHKESDRPLSAMQNDPTRPVMDAALPDMPLQPVELAPGQVAGPVSTTMVARTPSRNSHVSGQSRRPGKSVLEVERLKTERRHEIEKRCLQPPDPIFPEQLEHLETFQAAIQIARPLDDVQWENLRPRIQSEYYQIMLQEQSRATITAEPIPGHYKAPLQSDELILANAQKPTRDKIREYANDYIKRCWRPGSVNHANAPTFAAEVLQHTRRRFYEVQAREDALQVINNVNLNQESVSGSVVRSLKLEHMKWVYDVSIKPYTDFFRKELFLCRECAPTAPKFFAFDSVVQHFASKHTLDLSQGQKTVWWKAEWPANPPFHPHPDRIGPISTHLLQTPSLSHAPQSISSAESIRTLPNWKPGIRTPETISVASNFTSYSHPQLATNKWGPQKVSAHSHDLPFTESDDLAVEARHVWDQLRVQTALPDSLRLFTVLYHVGHVSRKRRSHDLALSTFFQLVFDNADQDSLRSLKDLQCQVCLDLHQPGGQEEHTYSLLDLLTHFKTTHTEQAGTPTGFDWKTDLNKLPRANEIKSFLQSRPLSDFLRDALNAAHITSIEHTTPTLPGSSNRTTNSIVQSGAGQDVLSHHTKGDSSTIERNLYSTFRPNLGPSDPLAKLHGPKHSHASRSESLAPNTDYSDNEDRHVATRMSSHDCRHEARPYNVPDHEDCMMASDSRPQGERFGRQTSRCARGPDSNEDVGTPRSGRNIISESLRRSGQSTPNAAERFLSTFDPLADAQKEEKLPEASLSTRYGISASPHSRLGDCVQHSTEANREPSNRLQRYPDRRRQSMDRETDVRPSITSRRREAISDYAEQHQSRMRFAQTGRTAPHDRYWHGPVTYQPVPAAVIEYDEHGLPIESGGYSGSTTHANTRRSYVVYSERPDVVMEAISPEYERPERVRYQEVLPQDVHYPEHRRSGSASYVHDRVTGRYYIQQPPTRQYIELDSRLEDLPPRNTRVPVYREVLEHPSADFEMTYEPYDNDEPSRTERR